MNKNIQETQTFEPRDLVKEDKHDLSTITNQASLELSSSFQEVQKIKSRTCIEEDRYSRNDTEIGFTHLPTIKSNLRIVICAK